jgi:hypothetical protein
MAEKEIVAQIDKLRKTRPARALEVMTLGDGEYGIGAQVLTAVLGMLRDDLKDEARLVEQAKLRGGTSIIKDRLTVAGWLDLFVVQLGRETDAPQVERQPAPERTEPATTHEALNSFVGDMTAQGRGELLAGDKRCAAQGIDHDVHTWIGAKDEATGSSRWRCWGGDSTPVEPASVTDYLSGASDTLPHGIPLAGALVGALAGALVDASDDLPRAAEYVATLPNGSMSFQAISADESERQGRELIEQAAAKLGVDLNEQSAHDTIDREYAHVTADPFAPIPRAVWAPAVPPNGRAWTSADLLAPVDAASLPAHLSFSQATTAVECGAKYRMQRIANAPQVPQWANVGGKAFHSAVELIERGKNGGAEVIWEHELEAQIFIVEQASGMTREQFRASAQGREGYDWWRVEGAAMLQRYVAWRQGIDGGAGEVLLSGPTGAPMLEWETTYDVDGVPFKTILDSVWLSSNAPGTAIIRDWKTGSMTPDNRQLCTQAWGLRMAGWEGDVLVQFFDARKGTFSEPFDPFDAEQGMTWDDVRYFVLSADAQRRLPILPARPSDFCGGCSVAYACPIMSQRKTPKAATK